MIKIWYDGQPRPDFTDTYTKLGKIRYQHWKKTETEVWYSDDPDADRATFEKKEREVRAYNEEKSRTMPIWM